VALHVPASDPAGLSQNGAWHGPGAAHAASEAQHPGTGTVSEVQFPVGAPSGTAHTPSLHGSPSGGGQSALVAQQPGMGSDTHPSSPSQKSFVHAFASVQLGADRTHVPVSASSVG
jgi:hypothetical protein